MSARVTTPYGIKVGWGVSVALKQAVAGLTCYVGEVQHVDDRGLRVTSMDWFTGLFTGMDFAFPWDNVLGLQVCTDQHDFSLWAPDRFQNQCKANLLTEDEWAAAQQPARALRGRCLAENHCGCGECPEIKAKS